MSRTRRHGRLRSAIESLERRIALAIHTEDFSDDLVPALAGFDSSDADPLTTPGGDTDTDPATVQGPDELLIPHQVGTLSAINRNRFGNSGHFLTLGASVSPNVYLIDFAAGRSQAGGLVPEAEVVTVGFRFFGSGQIVVEGDNGVKTLNLNGTTGWSGSAVVSNDPADGGGEVGAIQRIRFVAPLPTVADNLHIDDVSVLVLDSGFSNNAPEAADDFARTLPGEPVNIDLTGNDVDIDGDSISLVEVRPPANGSVAVVTLPGASRPTVMYTPIAGFHGIDNFEYVITDNRATSPLTATGTVQVLVNTPPPALHRIYTRPHGSFGAFTVSADDGLRPHPLDVDGDALSVLVTQSPLHGTVTVEPDGSFTYTPTTADGRVLGDFFMIIVSDPFEPSEPAFIEITIPNTPPEAEDLEYRSLTHAMLGQPIRGFLPFADAENDPVKVAARLHPGKGNLTIIDESTGEFEYRIGRGDFTQNGVIRDSFTFVATDVYGAESEQSTVTLEWPNAEPEFDDAVLFLEFGNAPPGTTLQLTGNVLHDDLSITKNPEDRDGDALQALRISTFPQNGRIEYLHEDGSFLYVPNELVFGRDQFGYVLTDGYSESEVIVKIIEQYDLRVPTLSFLTPLGSPLTITAAEIIARTSFANGMPVAPYANGIEVFVIIVNDPSGSPIGTRSRGKLVSLDGQSLGRHSNSFVDRNSAFVYLPPDPSTLPARDPPEFTINDEFEYYVTIGPPGGSQDRWLRSLVISYTNVAQSDSDGVLDALEGGAPNGGDGNRDGVLDRDQANVASFPSPTTDFPGYVTLVSPPGTSLSDVFSIPISSSAGVNFPFGMFHFWLTGLDDGEAVTLRVILSSALPGGYAYFKIRPNVPFGEDPFYIFDYDGTTGAETHDTNPQIPSNEILLHFRDGRRGDDGPSGVISDPGGPGIFLPPVAMADSYDTQEDQSVVVLPTGILGNDISPSGDPLIPIVVAGPANGTLTLPLDGSFTYNPAANFNGVVTFTYKVNDGRIDSDQTVVTINVTPVNDAPVATASGPPTGPRGQTLTFTLNATDVEPDDQAAGYTYSIDWNGDGQVDQTVVGPASLTVEHIFESGGSYSVKVIATDQHGAASAPSTHSITIAEMLPRIESVILNDGHAQRSMISSITVTFDSLVTIDSGAFELRRQGSSLPVGLIAALREENGRTVAVLTFSGHGIIGGSLFDGRYTLVIHGDKIRGESGQSLDGDGDGVAGGNRHDEFFRRFGDSDGDGDVDTNDRQRFLTTFSRRAGDSAYLWYFDFENDGRVGLIDLLAFTIASFLPTR
jgi:hypothetical protein